VATARYWFKRVSAKGALLLYYEIVRVSNVVESFFNFNIFQDVLASQKALYCPNCGGISVSDCLDCDGFLNTGSQQEICFDRKLFSKKNTDEDDPENHYHYLWRDLLGIIRQNASGSSWVAQITASEEGSMSCSRSLHPVGDSAVIPTLLFRYLQLQNEFYRQVVR
jgi:hypothetical protein